MPLWIYMLFVSTLHYFDIDNVLSRSIFFYGFVSVMKKTLTYHKIKCDDYKIDIAAHFSELFSSNGSAFISQQGSSSWNVFYWLYQHPRVFTIFFFLWTCWHVARFSTWFQTLSSFRWTWTKETLCSTHGRRQVKRGILRAVKLLVSLHYFQAVVHLQLLHSSNVKFLRFPPQTRTQASLT